MQEAIGKCDFCGVPKDKVPFLITSSLTQKSLCATCIVASMQVINAKVLAGEIALAPVEKSPIISAGNVNLDQLLNAVRNEK